MKKLFIIVLLAVFSSCTLGEMNPETTETIARISARRIGGQLQTIYPDIALEVHRICAVIIPATTQGKDDTLKEYILELLSKEIEDKLLVADIIDLIDLIKIEPNGELTDDQLQLINLIAKGLTIGIELVAGDSWSRITILK